MHPSAASTTSGSWPFSAPCSGRTFVPSDIDVLVEFEPGHVPGLAFFSMEDELSEILGHKVELHTPQFLSRYFRDKVMADAEIQYVPP